MDMDYPEASFAALDLGHLGMAVVLGCAGDNIRTCDIDEFLRSVFLTSFDLFLFLPLISSACPAIETPANIHSGPVSTSPPILQVLAASLLM